MEAIDSRRVRMGELADGDPDVGFGMMAVIVGWGKEVGR